MGGQGTIVIMLAWMVLSLACRDPRPMASPEAPNILLISLDTVRRDHLSPYQYERDTSPHLSTLAQSGATFTHSYAQASATTPTHASIFTGLHPFEHEAYGYSRELLPEQVTMAEILRDHGWRTVAATSSMKFERGTGFQQGFDDYNLHGEGKKNKRSAAVNESIIRFAAAQGDRPVFAFVHYFDAHAPYSAPAPYRKMWHPGLEEPHPTKTIDFIERNRRADVPAETLEYLAALYDGNIRFVDDNLRALLEGISIGNERSTLLIITADHGEAFGEHGYLGHSTWVYEEIVQVPLIMHWPGHIPAGIQLDAAVQSIDLLPTLGELVGVAVPEGLPGRSHAGAVLGGPATAARTVGEVSDPVIMFNRPKWWGISGTIAGGRYKLTRHGADDPELFLTTVDSRASLDIIAQHQREASLLMQAAQAMGVPLSAKSEQLAENVRTLSEEQIEQLKAMGYIDEIETTP